MTSMKLTFPQLRLPDEELQFQQLWQNPAIPMLAGNTYQISCFDSQRRMHLANSIRISHHMLPNLCAIVDNAFNRLQLNAEHEVYVHHDSNLSASVSADPEGNRISILVTSALVERLSTDELAFVIGHELGHVAFEHTRLPAKHILADNPKLDTELTLALLAWSRRAELSADRAGLWVCENFDAAASAFIKLACGLSALHMQWDIDGYLAQLDCLANTSTLAEDVYTSHPFSPVRVAVLHSAWHNGHLASQNKAIALLKLLEAPINIHADSTSQFLLWGQLAIATSDGEFDHDELQIISQHHDRDSIMQAIAELNNAIKPTSLALERALQNAKPLVNAGQAFLDTTTRCQLMQTLILTARADQKLEDAERLVLAQLCQALELRESTADNMLSMLE